VKRTIERMLGALLLGLILIACSPGAAESPQSSPSSLLPTATSLPDQAAVEPASTILPTDETDALAEPAPTATSTLVETAAPPIRTEQTASDPASFTLAAGQVQLVKFFAFW
jgi:hypothetical protein